MTAIARMPIRVTRRFLLLSGGTAIAACSVSACSNLVGPPPSPLIYVLEPSLPPPAPAQPVKWQLAVSLPRAQASLDTMRIALRRTPAMLDYYADAAWSDRLPILLQDLLVESFERSRRIVGVARDTSGIAANYRLDTELRQFEARYDQADTAPRIMIRLEAKLAGLPARNIVGSLAVTQEAQAQRNDLASIIAAFNAAGASALQQIVEWTFRELPTG
jgi:cholesterol transport system auxiliary component